MDIKQIPIDEIIPYELNAKTHPQTQIDMVAESIKQFGWRQPIVVDKDHVIIIGHCRYMAAKQLGIETVPCQVASDLTDEQVRKLRIVDNKSNESEWDFDLLKKDLEDLDLSDFGIDFGIVVEEVTEVHDDDFDIEAAKPIEPESKPGDIYQLGDHRLMCGDSTNENDVKVLMNGEVADLLFTDPPYNVNVSNADGLTIENDNLDETTFASIMDGAMRNAFNVVKEGGAFYCWYAELEVVTIRNSLENAGFDIKQNLIWVKNSFNFGRQDYKWQHEPCLYGWKPGASHYFVEEFNHSTVTEDEPMDFSKMKKEELVSILEDVFSEKVAKTVIHENKPSKNDLHPTMKPLRMCGSMIRHSSKPGELVLDLFGGSGSTLIVCEQLGRRCNMMELDPAYVDVIIARWESFTGKKAIKL